MCELIRNYAPPPTPTPTSPPLFLSYTASVSVSQRERDLQQNLSLSLEGRDSERDSTVNLSLSLSLSHTHTHTHTHTERSPPTPLLHWHSHWAQKTTTRRSCSLSGRKTEPVSLSVHPAPTTDKVWLMFMSGLLSLVSTACTLMPVRRRRSRSSVLAAVFRRVVTALASLIQSEGRHEPRPWFITVSL